MTRYATPYGCYEITPVPGQPQICALGYDYATCTVDAQNQRQQKVLRKAGWHKTGEFQNSKTGGAIQS